MNIQFFTHRLQVGHHVEDDEVVEEVEESRDSPLQGIEEGGAGGKAELSARSSLWRDKQEEQINTLSHTHTHKHGETAGASMCTFDYDPE